ncbi:MAG: hypothetical protein US30_C0001G0117 [Candidatus Moranbacteria bacterium GW2011_GWF2_36_839]|nr:MAG: hypothetical protein US27_C0001G0117 [Candidatus Moranbacteria bacterium GW2011_GWF1_36_78]KKQ17783.1 MAG: hypothetical protein US30_C0001G0117 [Candidatus Moranbacteria bacterium GW2011_GWF2_36_839]HAT73485.1 hypothetical protein [Candidatus Moranbacteria bacterium]HBY10847.1 hypothetical protein [Candidatus Moranbacteria bacterium]
MNKTKVQGIAMIALAVILIAIIIAYTTIFSVFGVKSGGSILMLLPLIIIAILLIVGLSFLFRAGIRKMKN